MARTKRSGVSGRRIASASCTPPRNAVLALLTDSVRMTLSGCAKRYVGACRKNMAAGALVDTGAILAMLDARDPWHVPCITVFRQLRMPVLTSEAMLTEMFHMTGPNRAAMEAAWKFVRSGTIVVGAIEDSEMAQLRALMLQYWDRPMDFVDATLVHLANRESLSTILTVDQADFATYRLAGKRRFQVLPIRRPSS